ncbi:MAG TPA: hypothetical protein EYP10_08455, partial [Armatimonadetes bacterium]|nr:hypothetical protein [Armatimonadota bacterium]
MRTVRELRCHSQPNSTNYGSRKLIASGWQCIFTSIVFDIVRFQGTRYNPQFNSFIGILSTGDVFGYAGVKDGGNSDTVSSPEPIN